PKASRRHYRRLWRPRRGYSGRVPWPHQPGRYAVSFRQWVVVVRWSVPRLRREQYSRLLTRQLRLRRLWQKTAYPPVLFRCPAKVAGTGKHDQEYVMLVLSNRADPLDV